MACAMGQCNLSVPARHTDINTDQILFPHRTAVKGNSVVASPPGISTPKKHGEMKGDMEICPDTAVSEQTRHRNRLSFLHRVSGSVCLDRFSHSYSTCACSQTHPRSPLPLQHHIPRRHAIDSHRVLTQPTIHRLLFHYLPRPMLLLFFPQG